MPPILSNLDSKNITSTCPTVLQNDVRKQHVNGYIRCASKRSANGHCRDGYIYVDGYYKSAVGSLKLTEIVQDTSDNSLVEILLRSISDKDKLTEINTLFQTIRNPSSVALPEQNTEQTADDRIKELINHKNIMNQSAMHHAALLITKDIYQLLVQNGGDDNVEDNCGFTPKYLFAV